MIKFRSDSGFNKALKVGFICVFTYLASYLARNVLSVLTPTLLNNGIYTKTYIASLSSSYFIVYAAGQLLNGVVGDIIKPKIMVLSGLSLAGISLVLFPFIPTMYLGLVCFAVMGFGLSMIRGPLVKVIAENTLEKYAQVACVFLLFASFVGPLAAGLLAIVLKWKAVSVVSGIITAGFGIMCYAVLTYFENKGIVKKTEKIQGTNPLKGVFDLFKIDNFIIFMLIEIVIEISASSISFWIPTYVNEYLGFAEDISGIIFSFITFLKAFSPFLALYIYKLSGNRDIAVMKFMFAFSAFMFVIMFFVSNVWFNIIIFTLALMAESCASTMIWSIYIPSLAKTGKVSAVNGILDSTGYLGASVANLAFAAIMESFGWGAMLFVWSGVMLVGAALTFICKSGKEV